MRGVRGQDLAGLEARDQRPPARVAVDGQVYECVTWGVVAAAPAARRVPRGLPAPQAARSGARVTPGRRASRRDPSGHDAPGWPGRAALSAQRRVNWGVAVRH